MVRKKFRKTLFCIELTKEELETLIECLESSIAYDENSDHVAQQSEINLLESFKDILGEV